VLVEIATAKIHSELDEDTDSVRFDNQTKLTANFLPSCRLEISN